MSYRKSSISEQVGYKCSEEKSRDEKRNTRDERKLEKCGLATEVAGTLDSIAAPGTAVSKRSLRPTSARIPSKFSMNWYFTTTTKTLIQSQASSPLYSLHSTVLHSDT